MATVEGGLEVFDLQPVVGGSFALFRLLTPRSTLPLLDKIINIRFVNLEKKFKKKILYEIF